MQITLTMYPRFEPSVTILIRYLPELDNRECEGWWEVDNNYVALSWRLYRDFSRLEKQSEKKSFFQKLKKISKTALD